MTNDDWYPPPAGSGSHFGGDPWPGQAPQTPPPSVPSTRSRWWKSRPAVGVGAGLVGLIIGASLGGSPATDTSDLTAKVHTLTEQREVLQDQIDGLEDGAIDQDAAEEQVASAVAAARAEARTAQQEAVAKAVARERKRADRRVAAAESTSVAKSPISSSDGGGTDPRFGTCGEANDNGYGPYASGVDPEYAWYQDRDGDGVVCES